MWLRLGRVAARAGVAAWALARSGGLGCGRVAGLAGQVVQPAERLDPVFAAQRAPFGSQFPGLAPPEHVKLDPARLTKALNGLGSVDDGPEAARIGLVRAVRHADVPAVLGWAHMDSAVLLTRGDDNMGTDNIPLVAILRSWEERFGATLLQLGPSAELRVLAERPPATIEAATVLAAEHWAFCDGWLGGYQLDSVQEIAAALMVTPIWSFWWD